MKNRSKVLALLVAALILESILLIPHELISPEYRDLDPVSAPKLERREYLRTEITNGDKISSVSPPSAARIGVMGEEHSTQGDEQSHR